MKRVLIAVSVVLGVFLALPAVACEGGQAGDRVEGQGDGFTSRTDTNEGGPEANPNYDGGFEGQEAPCRSGNCDG